MRYYEILNEVNVSSEKFRAWFGDSKIVDADGKPLKLFRGLYGPYAANPTEWMKPRKGYAAFFSTSPHLASSYGTPDSGIFADNPGNIGAVYPVYIKADVLYEFPAKLLDGYRSFDMFAFDDRARLLKAGEALVVRQVCDVGPRASTKIDPEKLYSRPSDIYAVGSQTPIESAVSGDFHK